MKSKSINLNLQKLIMCAIFIAAQIVLSRFLSINTQVIKIGFSFVPVFLGGYLLGPIYGGMVGALGDLIGAILFPIGPYFPGFTFTGFLSGAIFGILLRKDYKDRLKFKISLSVLIDQLMLSLLLNTFWIHILYGSSYKALLISRLPQVLIMCVVEPVLMFGIVKVIKRERFISNKTKNEKNNESVK